MKILATIVILVGLLLLAVLVIGALLPRQHRVARSVLLDRPPAEIYALLRDLRAGSQWRAGVQRTELLGLIDGHERFREYGKNGAVTYEIVQEQRDRELTTRIVDEHLGYSGSWTYTLIPEGKQTRLTITENGEVSNIVFRFMSRFVFGQTATIDAALAGLVHHYTTR